jgi:hypothetical protein
MPTPHPPHSHPQHRQPTPPAHPCSHPPARPTPPHLRAQTRAAHAHATATHTAAAQTATTTHSNHHRVTMPNQRTTTERGLGYDHQRNARRLRAAHIDGTPCPCLSSGDCGPGCLCAKAGYALPMYRDATLNPDGRPLEADHTLARARGGKRADRLMLSTCNRSRGQGNRVTTGQPWWSRDWTQPAGL